MRSKIIVALGVVVMLGAIAFLGNRVVVLNDNLARSSRTIVALTDTGRYYKTKYGDTAHKMKALELSLRDLKNLNGEWYKRIQSLESNGRRVESASETIVDVRYRAGLPIKAGKFEFKNPHTDITGEVLGDSLSLSLTVRDTIDAVISVRPKKFLFIKWGVKSVEFDVANRNPNVKLRINKAVKFY